MGTSLALGMALDDTMAEMLSTTLRLLDFASAPTKSSELDLYAWTQSIISHASVSALYGSDSSPFQDPAVETGLWAVHEDFAYLGLNFFSNIICPRGDQGRTDFSAAFKKYYEEKGQERASRFVRARYEVQRSYKLCDEDIARFDLSICLALLVNTVPAAFWTLYYVYSQPSLLEEVRATIEPRVQLLARGLTRLVNIADVVTGSPLMASIIQETLRVQSITASARNVLEDTILDNQYLLKRGSTVLVPSAELHKLSSAWGSSPRDFNARRFVSDKNTKTKTSASVFRAFGGGSNPCPGRFLAANEMAVLLVIMVLKFDMDPADDRPWPRLQGRRHGASLMSSILAPEADIRVKVRERKGCESVCWTFEWSNTRSSPELSKRPQRVEASHDE